MAQRITSMTTAPSTADGLLPVAFAGNTTNYKIPAPGYAFRYWCGGRPDANELLFKFQLEASITFSALLAGCSAEANTAATGSSVFTLSKSATQGGSLTTIGTLTFGASGTEATLAGDGGAIDAGEWITFRAPSSQDATLADIAFLFNAALRP